MLPELAQAVQDGEFAIPLTGTERGMPELEPQQLEQSRNALLGTGSKQAGKHRISRVERDADRHRLAMPNVIVGQAFQLVRRPMAKIERSSAPGLERVPAVSDLMHMKLGTAADHRRHGRTLERR